MNVYRRPVNNHNNVKLITDQVGATIAQENLKPISTVKGSASAKELIIQIDGGHIPNKEKDKRSFETLSGIVYRPSCIQEVDRPHCKITDKSCAISAMDDDLQSIKTYLYHAALKQRLSQDTHAIALGSVQK